MPRINFISKFSAPNIAFLAFWLAKISDYEPIFGVLRHMENSAPSLKIFALLNCGNKNRRQNPVREFTKTIIPFALVGYEVIITNSRYALVGYFITSYPTQAHGIIVNYRGQCINKVDISLNIKQKQKNNAMQPLQPHQLGNGIFMCLILGCSTGSIMLTVKKNDYVKDKRYLFEACSGQPDSGTAAVECLHPPPPPPFKSH